MLKALALPIDFRGRASLLASRCCESDEKETGHSLSEGSCMEPLSVLVITSDNLLAEDSVNEPNPDAIRVGAAEMIEDGGGERLRLRRPLDDCE